MKLSLLGRNYFDSEMSIEIPNYKLQIWPGFSTTMRVHDRGLLYGVQVLHKVLRKENVFQILCDKRRELEQRNVGMDQIKRAFCQDIIGTVVITHYNKRTYRIDDINWNMKPTDTFPVRGVDTSFVEYYENK